MQSAWRNWFDTREAADTGLALADSFSAQPAQLASVQDVLKHADGKLHGLRLNLIRRVRLAASFKWRLLERGIDEERATAATRSLLLELSLGTGSTPAETPAARAGRAESADQVNTDTGATSNLRRLIKRADQALERGDLAEASGSYKSILTRKPRNAIVLNNLGVALSRLGRLAEAEEQLRLALKSQPDYYEALVNLACVLMARGDLPSAQNALHQVLKRQPGNADARAHFALTLVMTGRVRDAVAQYRKALQIQPEHPEALFGLGLAARAEGKFSTAADHLEHALRVSPGMPRALAALAGLRRMTTSDHEWRQEAERAVSSGLSPVEEAGLRYALGKYHDDLEQFDLAFLNFERANQLTRSYAVPYDAPGRTRFVDDLLRVYTRRAIAARSPEASTSQRPIFVMGMARSGTSLVEQIIASHPQVTGAGELGFWNRAVHEHEQSVRQAPPEDAFIATLRDNYLAVLAKQSQTSARVVDKAPINCDYLGLIHAVFPNACFIYMRRDPIDTCLSCYFQPFTAALNFTQDLTDLAHYYQQHRRLMAHWKAVLPKHCLLEVAYEDLVANQEIVTRRILDFLGLPWEQRCLEFQITQRFVVTSSYWQVRQRIYNDSVQRWRKYRKHIGPLLELR